MKTADKFILKSYLGPMFASFFIVMFILLMNVLWRYIDELVGKGLPLSIIAELLFYTTATLIPLGLPLATLFAAIMTLGNLGENYELLALKAAGISLPRIIRPITVMACLISVGSFFVMNNFVPYSYQKMGNILFDIRQMKQEIEFQDGVFFNGIPHVSIRVKKQDPKTKLLTDVLIYDTRSNNTVNTIVADSGYISLTKDKSLLKVMLFDGQSYEENRNYEWYERPKLRHYVFKYEEMVMPLEGFSFKRSDSSLFGDESEAKNIKELDKDIDSLRVVADKKINDMVKLIFINHIVRNDTLEYYLPDSVELAAEKSYRFTLKEAFDTLSIDKKTNIMSNATSRLNDLKFFVSAEHDNVRSTTVKLYGSLSDWHKKLALPVSILIFFLIGAPLGAIIRKGGLGTPVVISVMFFVIYYVITIMGESLVNEGAWPPILGIWISSIVLFPIAIFLTYKSATDSQLLDMDAYTSAFKKFTRIFSRKKKATPNVTPVPTYEVTAPEEEVNREEADNEAFTSEEVQTSHEEGEVTAPEEDAAREQAGSLRFYTSDDPAEHDKVDLRGPDEM
ncbi:MAG: LptF/LptG family permease, partial [Rikenellaceae bacterium]|nr:LptF/LptG family permease [Rikenellaceae bacterium]